MSKAGARSPLRADPDANSTKGVAAVAAEVQDPGVEQIQAICQLSGSSSSRALARQ